MPASPTRRAAVHTAGSRASECAERAELARSGPAGGGLAREALDIAHAIERRAQRLPRERIVEQRAHRIEPRIDGPALRERSQNPRAKQPRAHWRRGAIEYIDERAAAIAATQRFDELEIAPRHLIERHRAPRALHHRSREVRNPLRLQLVQVAQQCAGRAHRRRIGRADAERLERRDAELLAQRIARERGIELPPLTLRDQRALTRWSARRRGALAAHHHHLARREARENRLEVRGVAHDEPKLAGREIGGRDSRLRSGHDERAEKVVSRMVEQIVREEGARSDRLDDLAANDALRVLRVLHLLADRDAVPLRHQLPKVPAHRLRGHARERHIRRTAIVARCEREPEHARCDLGVLIERLVELAEPVEQDRAGIARLHLAPVLHQRRLATHLGSASVTYTVICFAFICCAMASALARVS